MATLDCFFAEWEEQLRIRQQERAKAHGFSNYKEYEDFQFQEFDKGRAQYEAAMDEKCRILGKTRAELDAEDPQRLVERPKCDCKSHIDPFFCPQNLLSYNSTFEDSSGLLQYAHPPQIERLHMNEDDTSKRLSDEDLKRYWAMDSEKVPRELPAWVENDPVLQKIATTYEVKHPISPPTRSAESSLFDPHQIEPLQMNEDDTSKRLSDEGLGRYWGMNSQKVSRELPSWL